MKNSADYVMIEIPIPAGCSYREKPNNYWNRESHREYFKNRVAIFCEDLPIGKYTFTIPLEPRFSGTYTLNPTKAEQMYFPIFLNVNKVKILIVGAGNVALAKLEAILELGPGKNVTVLSKDFGPFAEKLADENGVLFHHALLSVPSAVFI